MGSVRIIGGSLRGRKLPCLYQSRPTPNRVRETLFNWLQPDINHSRCLDVFSGTGALGFEAISRGAAFVTLCERDQRLTSHFENLFHTWKLSNIEQQLICYPKRAPKSDSPYDIVFLDPPFERYKLASLIEWLDQHVLIHQHSTIYFEQAVSRQNNIDIFGWKIIRILRQGRVEYGLMKNVERE